MSYKVWPTRQRVNWAKYADNREWQVIDCWIPGAPLEVMRSVHTMRANAAYAWGRKHGYIVKRSTRQDVLWLRFDLAPLF